MRREMQIESPPRTMMEVFKSLPEGTLAELIDNVLYMSPSPIYRHQKVLLDIAFQIRQILNSKQSGNLAVAPFDVYLDESSNAVQPDIVVVLQENMGILNEAGHIHGVPDLLVEILSPGNSDHDLVRKKALYEKFGVKEYWIVDPESSLVKVFVLDSGSYQLKSEETKRISSPLLGTSFKF